MDFRVIVLFLMVVVLLGFWLLVLLKGSRQILTRIYSIFIFNMALWSLGLGMFYSSQNPESSIFWADFLYLAGSLIAAAFLHFSFVFPYEKMVISRFKQVLIYVPNLILFYLLFFTPIIIKGVTPPGIVKGFIYGPGHIIWDLQFNIIFAWAFIRFFKAYKRCDGIVKIRLRYIVLGTLIGVILAGITNVVMPWLNRFELLWLAPPLTLTWLFSVTYAILKYRLMDIKIVLTRAGIFAIVYFPVVFIPFWIASKFIHTKLWWIPTLLMGILATLGIFIYNNLCKRAESRLLAEERRARELLTQASEGMMRIRSIKRLVSLMVHVTCKILKLDNAAVFLLDEERRQYKVEAVRLKSKHEYMESLIRDDALMQRLSSLEEPLVYEEVRTQSQQLKDKLSDPIHEIVSQMESLSAALIIPASSRGQLLGFLVLGEKKSKRMYSMEDLNVLWVLSNQAALAIENAQFHKKAQEALLKEDREVTARFIGHGASHQFGNVLNRIIQRSSGKEMDIDELDLNNLSCDELKNMVLNFKEDFHAITNAGMQGKEIVSGILSLGAGSPVGFKQEDLKAIIQRSIQTIKLKQSKANIQNMDTLPEILADIPEALPKIWCNNLQIEQVLDNLLDNALEAIEEKQSLIKHEEISHDGIFRGKVIIKSAADNERLSLEILDNGIGIRQEDLKNMFTPFFTTKATERLSRKGHGIGMHMVKEILKAHQGKIYVAYTEYGKGTTFMIELPLKIAENKKI